MSVGLACHEYNPLQAKISFKNHFMQIVTTRLMVDKNTQIMSRGSRVLLNVEQNTRADDLTPREESVPITCNSLFLHQSHV